MYYNQLMERVHLSNDPRSSRSLGVLVLNAFLVAVEREGTETQALGIAAGLIYRRGQKSVPVRISEEGLSLDYPRVRGMKAVIKKQAIRNSV